MIYDHAQAQDRFPKGHLKFTILVDSWSSLLYAQFSDLCLGVKKFNNTYQPYQMTRKTHKIISGLKIFYFENFINNIQAQTTFTNCGRTKSRTVNKCTCIIRLHSVHHIVLYVFFYSRNIYL